MKHDSLISFAGECGNHPVGISDSVIIPNDNIGDPDANVGLEAIHVRMSDEKAWCNDVPAELTIDFGKTVEVCAIETRGYNDGGNLRSTTSFSLEFAGDDSVFSEYQENSNLRVSQKIKERSKKVQFWNVVRSKGLFTQDKSVSLMFLPHIVVICYLLLNRRTETLNQLLCYDTCVKSLFTLVDHE